MLDSQARTSTPGKNTPSPVYSGTPAKGVTSVADAANISGVGERRRKPGTEHVHKGRLLGMHLFSELQSNCSYMLNYSVHSV